MAPRRIVLLGATGSIGTQTCSLATDYPEEFQLVGIAARSNVAALQSIETTFGVPHCVIVAPQPSDPVPPHWGTGGDALRQLAEVDADIVCVAISGSDALAPTLAAIDKGRHVAIATKEVLVMAGDIVRERAATSGARIIPIDSEHSAIWQCLRGEQISDVARLNITASGGPFRLRDATTFANITVAEALRHPTWSMGDKITVDSATLMNKGLEIIEAHYLFDISYHAIDVVIHPSSIVHSFVEFCDGSVKAQLGIPDMRLPIALALTDGRRLTAVTRAVDLATVGTLEFDPLDEAKFPAVAVARQAGIQGGAAPCVLNAANEAAVAAFLAGKSTFPGIIESVKAALNTVSLASATSIDDLLERDREARRVVESRQGRAGNRPWV